jgi:hypothetical protein
LTRGVRVVAGVWDAGVAKASGSAEALLLLLLLLLGEGVAGSTWVCKGAAGAP